MSLELTGAGRIRITLKIYSFLFHPLHIHTVLTHSLLIDRESGWRQRYAPFLFIFKWIHHHLKAIEILLPVVQQQKTQRIYKRTELEKGSSLIQLDSPSSFSTSDCQQILNSWTIYTYTVQYSLYVVHTYIILFEWRHIMEPYEHEGACIT